MLAWFPVAMRFTALAGVIHQAVFAKFDRPYLLALYGGMLGLSEVAHAIKDNAQRRSQQPDEDESDEEG